MLRAGPLLCDAHDGLTVTRRWLELQQRRSGPGGESRTRAEGQGQRHIELMQHTHTGSVVGLFPGE